jgi:hypothetical protein
LAFLVALRQFGRTKNMTRKSRSATLLAVIASFSLATGTAFAASDRGPGATGYAYQNFWGETAAQPSPSATAAHQGGDRHEISLFPPNPNW